MSTSQRVWIYISCPWGAQQQTRHIPMLLVWIDAADIQKDGGHSTLL